MCCSKKSVRNAVLALFSMCFLVFVGHPVNARITPQGGSQIMVGNTAVAFRGVVSDYPNAGESTWYYTVALEARPGGIPVTFQFNLACASMDVDDAGTWDGSSYDALEPGGGSPVYDRDSATGAAGVEFVPLSPDAAARHFYFTVKGNYDEGVIAFVSKTKSGFDMADIPGPSLECVPIENDPPKAEDDFFGRDDAAPVTIDVLANDSDPDGDPLIHPAFVSGPRRGTVVVNADGSINYMPDDGFCGEDSFIYEISDGVFTDQAEVTISVACPANMAPKGNDDTFLQTGSASVSPKSMRLHEQTKRIESTERKPLT